MRLLKIIMAAAVVLAFTNPAAATRWTMWWSRPGPAPKNKVSFFWLTVSRINRRNPAPRLAYSYHRLRYAGSP